MPPALLGLLFGAGRRAGGARALSASRRRARDGAAAGWAWAAPAAVGAHAAGSGGQNVAERQYLIFNLLAGGKLAWDAGDWSTAASKWEALLRLPGLDPESIG